MSSASTAVAVAKALYGRQAEVFERLDRRNVRYRFDLDADLPWASLDAPGLHVGPRFLKSAGVDAEGLAAHPEAFELLQWSAGLEVSRAFAALESYLLSFVDDEKPSLATRRSLSLLYEEEQKHIALFERYGRHLESVRPEWVPAFDAAFEPYRPALLNPYNRDAYADAVVQHYFFWIKTLFFEEYTLYLHERLSEESPVLQPVWLAAHAAHRREEVQHAVTDAAFLESLEIDPIARRACALAFWGNLEQTFNLFLGIAASRDLVRAKYPECARFLPLIPTRELPIFDDVRTHPLFERTRRNAPGLDERPAVAPELSIVEGRPLDAPEDRNLLDALDRAAASDAGGLVYLDPDGTERRESYAELRERARHAAHALQALGLERGAAVPIVAEDASTFLPLFWGLLWSGLVPVPLGGRQDELIRRFQAALGKLGAGTPLIVPDAYVALVKGLVGDAHPVLGAGVLLAHVAPDEVPRADPDPEDVAFVQFSSGSTAHPKGVRLTHRNLLSNIRSIYLHQGGRPDDVYVSWLPLFHDMGLIGYHLIPVVCGVTQVHMQPLHFIRRPMEWLSALHRYKATVTASPNFGLAHTVERLDRTNLAGLDLSALHCLLCGAEPISDRVVRAFAEALAPAGFRAEAISPGYGLAEGSLCLTGKPTSLSPHRMFHLRRDSVGLGQKVRASDAGADTIPLVSVGTPVHGVRLRIVDDDGRLVARGVVGHLEARGPNVTPGYLGDPAATSEAFSDGWLRTGDLGALVDGELAITGRIKDLLIVNGQNVYAHDVEEELAAHVDALPRGRVAAFAVTGLDTGREQVALALAIAGEPEDVVARLVDAAVLQVRRSFAFDVDHVVVVESRGIPRTSSGKLQRGRLRARFERGELPVYERKVEAPVNVPAPRPVPPAPKAAELPEIVRTAWAKALRLSEESITPQSHFRDLGGDSLMAAHVHAWLEDRLGRMLRHDLLIDAGTPELMVRSLARELGVALEQAQRSKPVEQPRAEFVVRPGDVAIIGVGVRLPGAPTRDALWTMLSSGGDAFRPVPSERWDHAEISRLITESGHGACPTGAFLDDVFGFDPGPFGLGEAEAARTNPQYRLFLEASADALADAGQGRGRVGVFVSQGEAPSNCRTFIDELEQGLDVTAKLGNGTNNMVAALVSRAFDLTGPAVVVQAACASSLVAVHQARRSLEHDECEAAVVGGVELLHTPTLYTLFAPSGVLSARGACRPFSDRADGFVPGEGAAAVVLKRLDRALAQGDRIYAVIRGSAVGNDGRVFSDMAPNPEGQREVARRALAEAGVDPASITVIETHGTGTKVGDAVELRALRDVYDGSGGRCALTSVKSNVGHLLSAAGIASLAKMALAFERGVIPPIAGLERLDPRLNLDGSRLEPLASASGWPVLAGSPRRAAVNALGIGGTNCHVILEEAPATRRSARSGTAVVLALSAHDPEALRESAAAQARYLDAHPEIGLPAFASALARAANLHRHRAADVVQSRGEALAFLRAVASGGHAGTTAREPLVLLFPGPGSQFQGMAAALFEDAVFREAIEEFDAAAGLGWRVADVLAGAPVVPVDAIEASQPLVFAVSYATYEWLNSLGISADAVLGHSAGEYAALAVAGVLPVEDALRAVIARGHAMAAAGTGAMAAVLASEQVVTPQLGGHVVVAASNAPEQLVISGPAPEVESSCGRLEAAGISVRRLAIPCAAHSPAMEAAGAELARALEGCRFRAPSVTVLSTLTASIETRIDADYLIRQLREPVRFRETVERALELGYRHFVELGASAVLAPAVEATAAAKGIEVTVTPVQRRGPTGWDPALRAVARLFEGGQDVHFGRLLSGPAGTPELPGYPWRRRSMPVPFAMAQAAAARGLRREDEHLITSTDRALFAAHLAEGRPIAPAAWMLDRLLARTSSLADVLLLRPLEEDARRWRVVRDGTTWRFESRAAVGAWVTHLQAREGTETPTAPALPPRPADAVAIPVEEVYAALATRGLAYGPGLRTLRTLHRAGDELWVELEPTSEVEPARVDPGVLDGAFQALAAYMLKPEHDGRPPFLGFAFGRLRFEGPLTGRVRAHLRLKSRLSPEVDALRADLALADASGRVLLSIEDFSAKRRSDSLPRAYSVGWSPVSLAAGNRNEFGTIALLDGSGSALAAELAGASVRGPFEVVDGPAARAALRQADTIVAVAPSIEHACLLLRTLVESGRSATVLLVTAREAVTALARAAGAEAPNLVIRVLRSDGAPLSAADVWTAAAAPADAAILRRSSSGWERPALTPLVLPTTGSAVLPTGGVCWIPGGTGGVGLALAEALATQGRCTLVLSGRRGELDAQARGRLEALGATVDVSAVDLARGDVESEVERIVSTHGRLDAVIHCAGVLDEHPLTEADPARLAAVLAPKRDGAEALLGALAGRSIEWLVFVSSLTALVPSPGQAAYAAANGALADIARRANPVARRVCVIDSGPWAEAGMVADEAHRRRLESVGLPPMRTRAATAAFLGALESGESRVVVTGVARERERALRIAPSVGPAQRASRVDTVQRVEPTPVRTPPHDLERIVREQLGRQLRRPGSALELHHTFAELGVDSLMAVEVVRALELRLGVTLHPTLLFEHPTPAGLVRHLAPRLPRDGAPPPAPVAAPPPKGQLECWLVESGPEGPRLRLAHVEARAPAAGEVVVGVEAWGTNFIDALAAIGLHPMQRELPMAPGHEIAGRVIACGRGVIGLSIGDRVAALVPGGGFARQVVAPRHLVLSLPEQLEFSAAAGLLVTGLTAIACVEDAGRVRRGDRVLVQAAAGATGLACAQLALHHGARVFGTASTAEKLEHLRAMGVEPIPYLTEPFDDAVRARAGEVDVIIDSLSGDSIRRGLAVLARGGRFVEIGAGDALLAAAVDPRPLFLRGQTFAGVNLGAIMEDGRQLARLQARLLELVSAGALRPEVHHRVPFAKLPEALELLRSRARLGKVGLVP